MRHLDTHETRAAMTTAYIERRDALSRFHGLQADHSEGSTMTRAQDVEQARQAVAAADDALTAARAAHSLALFCAGQPETFEDNRQVIAAAAHEGVSLIVQLECGPADVHSPRVAGDEALARIEAMDEDEVAHVQVVGILSLPEVC